MPITSPDLTILLTENTGCTGISVADTTPNYGLSGGPSVNDVETVTVKLTYNTLASYIQYVFTVASGTITACTLSIQGATPTNIFSAIPSTVWPFDDSLPFDLTADYGVTLPTFADDIYTVDYTIAGEVAAEEFEFTTTRSIRVSCNTRCCIDKKWAAIDPSCNCASEEGKQALYGESLLNTANYAANFNDLSNALNALNAAKALCDSNCGCGC